jgi:hypothetical protein
MNPQIITWLFALRDGRLCYTNFAWWHIKKLLCPGMDLENHHRPEDDSGRKTMYRLTRQWTTSLSRICPTIVPVIVFAAAFAMVFVGHIIHMVRHKGAYFWCWMILGLAGPKTREFSDPLGEFAGYTNISSCTILPICLVSSWPKSSATSFLLSSSREQITSPFRQLPTIEWK